MAAVISIIICTKGNVETLPHAVHSILCDADSAFDLIVANQGDAEAITHALAPYCDDPRLRLVHTPTRGLAAARNAGAAAARGTYLLYTDDDCVAATDWAQQMQACIDRYSRAGIIFGRVLAPQHDPTLHVVPSYDPPGPGEWDRVAQIGGPIGANMALRRAAFDVVEGFDVAFGPGAVFSSGDDHDMAARIVLAGYTEAVDPVPAIMHRYGQRDVAQRPRMWARDGYAGGALLAKHLRIGNARYARHVAAYFARFVYYVIVNTLLRRPSGGFGAQALAIVYLNLARGFLHGLRLPLDGRGAAARYKVDLVGTHASIDDRARR